MLYGPVMRLEKITFLSICSEKYYYNYIHNFLGIKGSHIKLPQVYLDFSKKSKATVFVLKVIPID